MSNKNNKGMIWLVILSILLGTLMSYQIKQDVDLYDIVSLKSLQNMKNDINNLYKEIEEIKELIETRKAELETLQNVLNDDDADVSELLINEINEMKLIAGLEDVQGPGIRIVISDNDDEEIIGAGIDDDIIHDGDIQILLNDLRRAGAEAISINGQRVLSRSEIKCAGPTIRVNGRSSANPFVITAIGDPKLLSAAINAPGTYGWQLREIYKLGVETVVSDNVYVPRYYWKDADFQFIKPIEEGEE